MPSLEVHNSGNTVSDEVHNSGNIVSDDSCVMGCHMYCFLQSGPRAHHERMQRPRVHMIIHCAYA